MDEEHITLSPRRATALGLDQPMHYIPHDLPLCSPDRGDYKCAVRRAGSILVIRSRRSSATSPPPMTAPCFYA